MCEQQHLAHFGHSDAVVLVVASNKGLDAYESHPRSVLMWATIHVSLLVIKGLEMGSWDTLLHWYACSQGRLEGLGGLSVALNIDRQLRLAH